jgi:alanine-synthesizing transaminase
MAIEHEIWVVQDFAYADLCFDGYEAPSILQVEGAKEVAVEFFSLSKSYNMPGWRVGFCCGNKDLLAALSRIKSYFDYGLFTPIQVAAIKALDEGDEHVFAIKETYKSRRDILVKGLNNSGWPTDTPKATMFVWSKIPDSMINLGSLEFSKRLLTEAKVAVSPGIGFGDYGEGYVRFSLIENEHRIKQAVRSIKKFISSQEKIHVLG